ncbi:SEC14-like protein 2 [Folsomia candida]|uniref:CRAL-TRIO domain-containing protein n=1 Tax=Folsomia candida TaxID=158441 RepID=A0A226E2Y2_FOLCA|nr:SEC14-like protein 2 [Folsomia candida]OXA51620.1 hypothetical protein Fcan01_13529 [Folsomia candida]
MSSMSLLNLTLLVVLIVGVTVVPSLSVSVEQDLALTLEEKTALDEFKKLINGSLPLDYMNQDIYLIRWLRAKSLDIPGANSLLRGHLKWRADNHMDTILLEDFAAFNESYPIYEGEDYEGRPVLAGDAGEWDVRRGIVTGQQGKGERFVYREIERACQKVREKQGRGENVTRFQAIFDLKGFNLAQHGCIQCVSMYVNILLSFQDHYPFMADNVIIVNAPPFFRVVLDILRPFAQPPLRGLVKRFGTNKEEWRKYLLNIIPPNQLPVSLGGTRE